MYSSAHHQGSPDFDHHAGAHGQGYSAAGNLQSQNPSPSGSNDDLDRTPAGDANARDSYLDSDLEMRKYQGLSAAGVSGYQAVGDVSEPGSPVNEGSYERSHESSSSGTKVEAASSSRLPRPETMSSEGSYDARNNYPVRSSNARFRTISCSES